MRTRFVVAGTDTDAGKTVFAAALAGALDAEYWKPVQSGTEGGSDTATVARLSELPPGRFHPETYTLSRPLSPHRAAELDDVAIDVDALCVMPASGPLGPDGSERPLVIELAGGLMVPLSRRHLQTRLLQKWEIPVILVARTALGTINHSLLSIYALRMHEVAIHGIAFSGPSNPDSERTICDFAEVKHLGRLPFLDPLDAGTLRQAFAENFRVEDFV